MMLLTLLVTTMCGIATAVDWDVATDLDNYVNSPESVYDYQIESIDSVTGATVYTLRMTSLTWFDETVTTTPVWWHWQVIVIPDIVEHYDSALLYVSGGSTGSSPPGILSGAVRDMIDFALDTGAVASLLEMVPNQPLSFVNDEFGELTRSEDAIIGYSWRLFINENITDPAIIANFPMTKAAKLAVDTLIDFVASVDETIQITSVMPTGYSKRGWVVWLLGCVDQRVFAMTPIVFDLLNFTANLEHHYRSFGGWSWAFSPYWEAGVSSYLYHPRTELIAANIDPFAYKERLTMPKLLMGGSGDQFFIPSGTHFWWDDMPGDNHYMLFENDDHLLGGHTTLLWENNRAFFKAIKTGFPLPDYSFSRTLDETSGTITLVSNTDPDWVRLWQADNTIRICENNDTSLVCRRDFRLNQAGFPSSTEIVWTDRLLIGLGGVYTETFPYRSDFGYSIFHFEMSYPGPGTRSLRVTTEAHVLEDDFPYEKCTSEAECQGELV